MCIASASSQVIHSRETDGVKQVLAQYRAATGEIRAMEDRSAAYAGWLARITDALEREPESPSRYAAQIQRLTLANGVGDHALTSSIADELRRTAPDLSERILWTMEGAVGHYHRYLVTREDEAAAAAVTWFADARRMMQDESVSAVDREGRKSLTARLVVANVTHAELLATPLERHSEAADLLIESVALVEKARDEQGEFLKRTLHDHELLLSRAAIEYGHLRQMDRAEELLARLRGVPTLREPLDRHFLRALDAAYPDGGREYQAGITAWIAKSPPGPIRCELLYRLGSNQAATLKLDEATRTFRRLVANYDGEAATDQHVRHYVREACHSLGWVLLRGAESAPYRKRFVELAQPDDVRLQRLREP